MLLKLILIISLYIETIFGACTFNAGGQSLDLSCLSGNTISLSDAEHSYKFTMCSNGASCPSSSTHDKGSAMVAQQNKGDSNFCFILGRWDSSVQPTQNTSFSAGSFQFEYQTGSYDDGCGNPDINNTRTWKPTFICRPGVEWQPEDGTDEVQESSCVYRTNIYTKYACIADQQSCSDDSSGLSGGWIFIIILVCGLFAYCVVGYIVMALTYNKDGGFKDFSNNIPNKTLWINCPKLVMAGCMVTKDFLVGLTNKGGSDKEDTLVEDSAGNEEAT